MPVERRVRPQQRLPWPRSLAAAARWSGRRRPAGRPRAGTRTTPLRSRCATITGAASLGGDGGEQRVQATDPGVAEPGALLGVAVDLDDRVVDIDQDRAVDPGQQRRAFGQPGQEPGGDRVELADVTEGEPRRNDPNVEGAYGPVEDPPIAPCRSSAMSSMLSAPATIPATSELTFNPALAPLSVGTLRCSSANAGQAALAGQRHHRDQPSAGHQIRVVEARRRDGAM